MPEPRGEVLREYYEDGALAPLVDAGRTPKSVSVSDAAAYALLSVDMSGTLTLYRLPR